MEALEKKRKKDFEEDCKLLDEKKRKDNEKSASSRRWEHDRRLRETEMLDNHQQLRKQAIISKSNRFREHLDAQCVSPNLKFVLIL